MTGLPRLEVHEPASPSVLPLVLHEPPPGAWAELADELATLLLERTEDPHMPLGLPARAECAHHAAVVLDLVVTDGPRAATTAALEAVGELLHQCDRVVRHPVGMRTDQVIDRLGHRWRATAPARRPALAVRWLRLSEVHRSILPAHRDPPRAGIDPRDSRSRLP